MLVLNYRNVNEALPEGIYRLLNEGVKQSSRAGDVWVYPTPVTTVYQKPLERVLCFPERDANPFFHFMEALWMLSGRNDVEWISRYNQSMRKYSDDGITFRGAYGHRWRQAFEEDQLPTLIDLLKTNPDTRRAVLQMWDCSKDLWADEAVTVDVPCNISAFFRIRNNKLDMTITNRSNDIIWGTYGANVVHFSFLLEYMAAKIGIPVGTYTQISNDFHAYADVLEKYKGLAIHAPDPMRTVSRCWYTQGKVAPYPLMEDPKIWDSELSRFMLEPRQSFREPFFEFVAKPLAEAHYHWRNKQDPARFAKAQTALAACVATDWYFAAKEWLKRREQNSK